MTGWDGLLPLDKPEGPTSHDLVDRVRRITGTRRVGHAGTLDPPASGLLPIVLGRATRLVRFLPQAPKVYAGTFELGRTTTSDDVTGATLSVAPGPLPEPPVVCAAAAGLVGRMDQRPPRVSARQVGGRRLYALARAGVEVAVAPRSVEILRFDVHPLGEPGHYRFEAAVTAGTYIRALVRDLGAGLGCGGTLATLRRTAIGALRVEAALPFPAAGPDPPADALHAALIGLDRMPLEPPDVLLPDAAAVQSFARGRIVPSAAAWPPGLVCARSPEGFLVGVGEVAGGVLHPRVVVAVD